MGKRERQKPALLAAKLKMVRLTLGLSQNEMISYLGLAEEVGRNHIANFESGYREPNLIVLLKYARSARITVDDLIDDNLTVEAMREKLRPPIKKRSKQ